MTITVIQPFFGFIIFFSFVCPVFFFPPSFFFTSFYFHRIEIFPFPFLVTSSSLASSNAVQKLFISGCNEGQLASATQVSYQSHYL